MWPGLIVNNIIACDMCDSNNIYIEEPKDLAIPRTIHVYMQRTLPEMFTNGQKVPETLPH